MDRGLSALLLVICSMSFSSCASYRVVKIGPGLDPERKLIPYYAVTKNNVVIPEYVVDRNGNYPTRAEEAEKRLQERRPIVDAWVSKTYKIPNSLWYQMQRFFWGTGLMITAPIAIPVVYSFELFSSGEGLLTVERKRKSFLEVVHHYFALSWNEPEFQRPVFKRELDQF